MEPVIIFLAVSAIVCFICAWLVPRWLGKRWEAKRKRRDSQNLPDLRKHATLGEMAVIDYMVYLERTLDRTADRIVERVLLGVWQIMLAFLAVVLAVVAIVTALGLS